jgi:CHAT domain-containing protein
MAEGLSFPEIVRSAGDERPLVYLVCTTRGSFALIVPLDARAIGEQDVVWLDGFTSLDEVKLPWAIANLERLQKKALGWALSVLGERLIGPLAERLGGLGFSEATIIPAGRLSLLPLPAAAPRSFTVALAPSARALRAARTFAEHTGSLTPVLLAAGNPLPLPEGVQPLAFAGDEAEAIRPLFGSDSRVLIAGEATRDSIRSSLAGTTHLHLACHGSFDAGEPLDSGLVLAGGERLTLRNLLDEEFELPSARLAVLSACRSGIIEYERVPDEAIGLPAGFLQAGVPGVVSTLWPVDDVSTALLVVAFYRRLLIEGLDPANALREAQEFLRMSSAEQLDLAGWLERRYEASGGTDADAFEDARYYRSNPDERPFEDPVYWAGFVFSGA